MNQKLFLSCGILAPLVYLGADRIAGMLIKDYSFTAQSMSDLGAAGSPTRLLVISLNIIATALLVAFGIGIWQWAGSAIPPRIVAGLIIGNAVSGLTANLFFPNQYGVRPEFGTPGVLLMFLSVLCFFLAMLIGAAAFHSWMRILSFSMPAAFIILAVLRFATAGPSEVGANMLVGVQERTMAYSFLAWVMILAIYLLMRANELAESAISIGG